MRRSTAAEAANPGLVVVDVSTFGRTRTARRRARAATSWRSPRAGCCRCISTNPEDGPMTPGPPPRRADRGVRGAATPSIAALGALHARLADGRGQRIDVSALEAMVATMATCLPTVTYAGLVPVAGGNRGRVPVGHLRVPRRHGPRAVHRGRAVAGARQDARRSRVGPPRGLRDDGPALRAVRRRRGARRRGRADVHASRSSSRRPTRWASRRAASTRRPTCWRGSSCACGASFRELVVGGGRRGCVAPASPIRIAGVEPPPRLDVPAVGQHDGSRSTGRRGPAGDRRAPAATPRSPGCASST